MLLTDAPCHGKTYHSCDDQYPGGDPKGRKPELQIKEFAKKDIQFNGVRMNNLTDKMFKILKESYTK